MHTIRICITGLFLALLLHSCSSGSSARKKDGAEKAHADSTLKKSNPAIVEPKAAFDTLRDGDFVQRYPNGIIQLKGFYAAGKREGEWAAFFPSGKLQSEGFFTHGKRDHHATVYYESGKKMYEGMYKDGLMIGKWIYYKPDGTVDHEEDNGKGK
jgi:antitoxin component YwqK of YwqJK toxin-antitoxin module